MSRCRHCGQGALMADYVGPICPDCIEEGYAEHAPTKPIAEATTAPADPLADERVAALKETRAFIADALTKRAIIDSWAWAFEDQLKTIDAAIKAQP